MIVWLHETWLFAIKTFDFPVFDESVTNRRTDGPTDGPTDGRTDRPNYRDARTHLRMNSQFFTSFFGRGALRQIFFFSLNSILASPLIDIDQTLSKKRHNFNFFDTQLTDRISMFQKKFRFWSNLLKFNFVFDRFLLFTFLIENRCWSNFEQYIFNIKSLLIEKTTSN